MSSSPRPPPALRKSLQNRPGRPAQGSPRHQQSSVDQEQAQRHETLRRLHRFHEGILGMVGVGERIERTPFVIDARTGRPVFPAPPGHLRGESIMLHIPEDEPGALHVLGRAAELDPLLDEACDRWLMYHGKTRLARWTALDIESIKNVDTVLDQDEAQVANPLHAAEPALCRWVNQHPAPLAEACRRSLAPRPSPRCSLVWTPYGMDVRAHFGVMRPRV